MIQQQELPELIEDSIPELSGICKRAKCKNAYDIATQMLKYTSQKVVNSNLAAAQDCCQLAEQLYKKGNNIIRNAIENVFVYSLTHTFFHEEDKNKVNDILPASLYELYRKQLLYSHL
ncbi:MAG: hypothetical protein H7257_14600 [Taibaiella sp.]|nr:hypothetical protein [Taibaiella sp.]